MSYIPERHVNFTLSRTAPPTLDVVTLDEARLQLRVDTIGSPATNPEDSLITDLIASATAELDAGTGWLGRALAPQTWRLGLDSFPKGYTDRPDGGAIILPYPPLISIESFTYVNSEGTTVTMVEGTDYRLIRPVGPDASNAKLIPLYNRSWPTARCDVDSVVITYRCGYSTGSPEDEDVPQLIKNAIKSRITDWYDSRGVEAPGLTSGISPHVQNALEGFRIYRLIP